MGEPVRPTGGMRVLITGGFGYLGSRLAWSMADRGGYQLTIGTRSGRGAVPWLPEAKVVPLRWESSGTLEDACRGCDAVVHLAGLNAAGCAVDPAEARRVNAEDTRRLLLAAADVGVKRFVFASTVHVYGSPLAGTLSEDVPPKPAHPYAESKYDGEGAVREASRSDSIQGVILRIANAFGAPVELGTDCWDLLINDICRQAVTTGRIELRSPGLQRRDFIPVSEVCRAVDHVVRVPAQRLGDGVFNVGSGWSPTVREIAEIVAERCLRVLGYRPPLIAPDARAGDVARPLRLVTRALERSGFEAKGDPMVELDRLLQYCMQHSPTAG